MHTKIDLQLFKSYQSFIARNIKGATKARQNVKRNIYNPHTSPASLRHVNIFSVKRT